MDHELQTKLGGLVRTTLGVLAGFAIGKKWMDQETANTLIQVVIGLVPLAIGYWSWHQKKQSVKIIEAGIRAPSSATVEQVVADVKGSLP